MRMTTSNDAETYTIKNADECTSCADGATVTIHTPYRVAFRSTLWERAVRYIEKQTDRLYRLSCKRFDSVDAMMEDLEKPTTIVDRMRGQVQTLCLTFLYRKRLRTISDRLNESRQKDEGVMSFLIRTTKDNK